MARNVSNEFKNVIQNGGPFYGYAEVLLHDGTQLTITSEDDLLVDGNEIQESGGDGFPLGVALSRTLNMSIDNTDDRYSDYDFYYARITMYTEIDLSSGGVERLKEGTFTVTEPVSPGDEIDFTAYDDMYKAAKTYVPKVSFPATALSVLQDVCSQCDINLGSATFLNGDFQIPSIPDNLTCRQVIGYIAMIAVGNAVFDENNRLLIKSYNFSLIESFPIISGGKYDQEVDRTISGGVLTDDTQNVVTGGEFGDESEMAVLSEFSSDPEISTDDVVITGIRMESLDSDSDEVYVYGTEDYALTVQNELVSGKEQELIQMIGDRIIGVSIRPFSGKFFPNPSVQFMDFVFLVDRKSNTYTTFIANNTFSYLNDSEYSNELESPLRNNSQYYSEITEVYRKAREEAQKQKSEWEKAMEELSDRVNNSSGLYMTSEEQPDGSNIYYLHDKPTLEESMIVWKMAAEAMAVSTDGGKTYNAGLTVDGTLITKIMTTIGLNFDWGTGGTLRLGGQANGTGILVVTDASGKEIGRWTNEGIQASDVNLNGTMTTDNGTRQTQCSGGGIVLKYKNVECGQINPTRYNEDDSQLGMDIETLGSKLTISRKGEQFYTLGETEYSGINYLNTWYGGMLLRGYTKVANSLSVDGTKSRSVKTENYDRRLLYCYEMPTPMFGDIGESVTDENGESVISIDDIFDETVSCEMEYQVFIQKEGSGDLWVEQKEKTYFVVKGTAGLKFAWEIKAKQKDFEYLRLDSEFQEEESVNMAELILFEDLERYITEQEEFLYD